jgi:hypothetical protein
MFTLRCFANQLSPGTLYHHHPIKKWSTPLPRSGDGMILNRRPNMKWITREYVKVDRVACPWLIKKFVDKDAEFIFVPADKVIEEANRLDAIPFDVKNVELGHHGKECSFEAIYLNAR